MLPFLVTPCLVVAVQACMERIPIKKKKKKKIAESPKKKLKEDKKDSLLSLDFIECLKTYKVDENMEMFIRDGTMEVKVELSKAQTLNFTLILYYN